MDSVRSGAASATFLPFSPTHPHPDMKTKLVPFFSAILLSSLAHGQDLINFSVVDETPINFAGGANIYRSEELGVIRDGLTFNAFNVTVGSGTGAAASLVGQSYLALCINLRYEAPAADLDYTYVTDGASLNYEAGSGDFWDANRAAKYTAVSNVIAALGSDLVSMNQGEAEFQEWMVAMSFALSEIIADYDGTVGSLSLASGDNQFRNVLDDSPISGSLLAKYQQAIGHISTPADPAFVLQAAVINNTTNQDVILIPVPEPSVISLAGILGAFGLLRRRRL